MVAYYTEREETPGVWIGSGIAGIDELNPGDAVTAEQTRAVFGAGLNSLAVERQQRLQGPDLTVSDYQSVTRLRGPSRSTSLTCRRSGSRWRNGSPPSTGPPGCRATGRPGCTYGGSGLDPHRDGTGVLRRQARTAPEDARELAATIAKHFRRRPRRSPAMNLFPMKSVNHLRGSLGVRFAERPNPDPRLRPVREIVGIEGRLTVRWFSPPR